MADYFVHPITGNDANDGTSYANRVKTINVIKGSLTNGDVVRYPEDGGAVDTGVNITWVHASSTATLSAAINKTVTMCNSAWTPGTGVAHSLNTTRVEGSHSIRLTITNASYTNGTKVGHFDTGSSQDFSAYQQINFQFRTSVASEGWEIRLCSDSAGNTPVNTFTLPTMTKTGVFYHVVIDNGSALGNSIRSVSLVRTSGSGDTVVYIDAIFCSKAPGAADCLTLHNVIGSNVAPSNFTSGVKEWYTIRYIDGTAIGFGKYVGATTSIVTVPALTDETTDLYKRTPMVLGEDWSDDITGIYGTEGGSAQHVRIEGGYDTTNMSTKVGQTSLMITNGATATMHFFSEEGAYIEISDINVIGGGYGFNLGGHQNTIITDCFASGCSSIGINLSCDYGKFNNLGAFGCTTGLLTATGEGCIIENCRANMSDTAGIFTQAKSIVKASYAGRGVIASASSQMQGSWFNCGFTEGGVVAVTASGHSNRFDNCAFGAGTAFSTSAAYFQPVYMSTNHNQVVDAHESQYRWGFLRSETGSDRHTADDIAWEFFVDTTIDEDFPQPVVIARIATVSGTPVTVSAYFKRDTSDLSAGLFVMGSQIGGPASDTSDLMTAGADTYEQLSVSWTPSESGVVEISAIFYDQDGTFWVDDMTFT